MAEPLERLLSSTRRNRRRPQWEPIGVQGGPSPGMRGAINPLDSVAISDSAQGVDISSVTPPTRLAADRIDEAYQPQEAAPANPFMFASQKGGGTPAQEVSQGAVRYERRCGPNGCQMVPVFDGMPAGGDMFQQQATALPPGVQVGPGETFVQGSLREATRPQATASAPMATAAPQQPAPAASLPQERPGPAAPAQRSQVDVMGAFAPALQRFQDARNAPSARQAVIMQNEATAYFRAAETAVRFQAAAEINRKADEIQAQVEARTGRMLDLKDPAYLEREYAKRLEAIRGDLTKAIDARANAAVEYKARSTPNIKYDGASLEADVNNEKKVIFSMDAGRLYGLQLAANARSQRSSDPADRSLGMTQALTFEGMLAKSVYEQFSTTKDPAERRAMIDASLRQPLYHSAVDHLKTLGRSEEQASAEATILAEQGVRHLTRRVESIGAGGRLFLKPPEERPSPQYGPALPPANGSSAEEPAAASAPVIQNFRQSIPGMRRGQERQ